MAGEAAGVALVLRQPLSLAGGLSLETGRIIDVHAPQRDALIAGHVLVMPVGRGSSTTSTVLAESLRRGIGPAAIILPATDQILAMGALIARMLYEIVCPILVAEPADYQSISSGDYVAIRPDGTFSVSPVLDG